MPPLPGSLMGSRGNWGCWPGRLVSRGIAFSVWAGKQPPPLGSGCPALLKSWGSEFVIGELGGPWPGEGAAAHPPMTAYLSPTGASPLWLSC